MVQQANVIHFPGLRYSSLRSADAEFSPVAAGHPGVADVEPPSRAQDRFIVSQLELFEAIKIAAAVVSRDERVVRLNRLCERILGPSLNLQRGRLIAQDRRSNERLRKAMQAVFSGHVASEPHRGQGAIVGEAESPIIFRALALGRSYRDGQPLFALLLFCSPQLQQMPDASLLSRAFGLTPAQARIATYLATGATLESVAARLGIKKETVRNHLKHIFYKVGARRQAELVALLSSLWLGGQP